MNNEAQMLDDLVQDFCRRAQLYGCDAVQVLMSQHSDKDGTSTISIGRGNAYARQGLAREFVEVCDAQVVNDIIIAEFEDGEEDE